MVTASSLTVNTDLIVYSNNVGVETHKVNNLFNVKKITNNYTILRTDSYILANGTLTITIPTCVGYSGDKYFIKNIGVGTVTVVPSGTEKIDGYTNMILTEPNSSFSLLSDGSTGWYIF